MKQLNLLLAIFIVALSTSCGSKSISEQEVLQIIAEKYGEEQEMHLTLPIKAESIKEFGYKLESCKRYEVAGLLNIENTTIKNWGYNQPDTPAVIIKLTDKGEEYAYMGGVSKVINYFKYKYDNVVDIRLINRLESPFDDKLYTDTYVVFCEGSITEGSPFATADNINVGDRYWQTNDNEPLVYMYDIEISYDHDEIAKNRVHYLKSVLKDEIDSEVNAYKEKNM